MSQPNEPPRKRPRVTHDHESEYSKHHHTSSVRESYADDRKPHYHHSSSSSYSRSSDYEHHTSHTHERNTPPHSSSRQNTGDIPENLNAHCEETNEEKYSTSSMNSEQLLDTNEELHTVPPDLVVLQHLQAAAAQQLEREAKRQMFHRPTLFSWSDDCCDLLSRTFFKHDNSPFKLGSQDEKDFWEFLTKYESHKASSNSSFNVTGLRPVNKLSLPGSYDIRYRVNFATLVQSRRPKELTGKGERGEVVVSPDQVAEFIKVVHLFVDFLQRKKFEKLVKIRKDRESLPIAQHKDLILNTVAANKVVVIAGDTGCGKSTQVPQYLLAAGYDRIACTQPRRIACMSLCRRVAVETLNEYGTQIAYQIRFDTSKSSSTRILFLTEGVLLRHAASDPMLSAYTVIIVDEVHERHLFGDFLLGILRDLVLTDKRPDLRLILMSATINVNMFSEYFGGAPVLNIPGRMYPIDVRYFCQEDSAAYVEEKLVLARNEPASNRDNIAAVQKNLDAKPYLRVLDLIDSEYPASSERGDVLIFMSGMKEILALADEISKHVSGAKKWIVLLLHSALSIEEQDKVFDIAPEGTRKCIVCTNIAETSVTIDGIRFVVDSGKVKEMGYDQECKMQRLQEYWVSQASAEQRKGRAGRTGPGICFRLYSRTEFNHFLPYTIPEIMRVPLEAVVLQIKALNLGDPRAFKFIQSPGIEAVESAIRGLTDQQAIRDSPLEELTPLGQVLSRLPVDVPIGKILVLGTLFRVLDPLIIMAAALTVQSPFVMKRKKIEAEEADKQTEDEFMSEHGDPFTLLNVYHGWLQAKVNREPSKVWCRHRGLEEQRLYELTKLSEQFKDLLRDAGLLTEEYKDRTSLPSRRPNPHKRELRRMQLERAQSRKRKVLSVETDDYACEEEENPASDVDLHDVDFMLSHNLDDFVGKQHKLLQEDVLVLQAILCSGLYPNIALPDDHNSFHKESEQVYHTKYKEFVCAHPSSVFCARPDIIQSGEALFFLSLLHTNKPYITSAIRAPALQYVLLYSREIDTNSSCTKIMVDQWLEFDIASLPVAQRLLSTVHELRFGIYDMLSKKLASGDYTFRQRAEKRKTNFHQRSHRLQEELQDSKEPDASLPSISPTTTTFSAQQLPPLPADVPTFLVEMRNCTSSAYSTLDELSHSLAEYLNTSISYRVRRLHDFETRAIFGTDGGQKVVETQSKKSDLDPMHQLEEIKEAQPTKRQASSVRITDFLWWNSIPDRLPATAEFSEHMQRRFLCPDCGGKFLFNKTELDRHLQVCPGRSHVLPAVPTLSTHSKPPLALSDEEPQYIKEEEPQDIKEEEPQDTSLCTEYFCAECNKLFCFSPVDQLRHLRTHAH